MQTVSTHRTFLSIAQWVGGGLPWSPKVKLVAHPVRQHQVACACGRVPPALRREIFARHQKPVVPKRPDEAPHLLPSIHAVHFAGIVKALPRNLEQHALLRIRPLQLASGQTEQGRVEGAQLFVEKVALINLDGILPAEGAVEPRYIVSTSWNRAAGVTAVDQKRPEVWLPSGVFSIGSKRSGYTPSQLRMPPGSRRPMPQMAMGAGRVGSVPEGRDSSMLGVVGGLTVPGEMSLELIVRPCCRGDVGNTKDGWLMWLWNTKAWELWDEHVCNLAPFLKQVRRPFI